MYASALMNAMSTKIMYAVKGTESAHKVISIRQIAHKNGGLQAAEPGFRVSLCRHSYELQCMVATAYGATRGMW